MARGHGTGRRPGLPTAAPRAGRPGETGAGGYSLCPGGTTGSFAGARFRVDNAARSTAGRHTAAARLVPPFVADGGRGAAGGFRRSLAGPAADPAALGSQPGTRRRRRRRRRRRPAARRRLARLATRSCRPVPALACALVSAPWAGRGSGPSRRQPSRRRPSAVGDLRPSSDSDDHPGPSESQLAGRGSSDSRAGRSRDSEIPAGLRSPCKCRFIAPRDHPESKFQAWPGLSGAAREGARFRRMPLALSLSSSRRNPQALFSLSLSMGRRLPVRLQRFSLETDSDTLKEPTAQSRNRNTAVTMGTRIEAMTMGQSA